MTAHTGERLKEKLTLKRTPPRDIVIGTHHGKQARVPIGHEALLNKYRKGETKVRFVFNSDQTLDGKVTSFDKYTVTVKSAGSKDDIGDLEVTIFKHAIQAFFPLPDQE
ncbi:RNA chaperone Hfq [Ectothiorhodospira shaposhnikovii]|uniref:RNA chaperone Hfq n=1 Tax=Ectothiorhodospira shaposhnikovii TaxID=1054 RepID=UPI001EE78786|nr:RNA chaperone Hfq [Ectothiorhodospira shaposhnikovii]MCG5512876.1 RNA chaperone Hfq [Ectothiorhodospira shaposhnikovii]